MLKTIRIPQNLKHLGEALPKPNYEPVKLMTMEKKNFLEVLERSRRLQDKQAHSLINLKQSGYGRRRSPPHQNETQHEHLNHEAANDYSRQHKSLGKGHESKSPRVDSQGEYSNPILIRGSLPEVSRINNFQKQQAPSSHHHPSTLELKLKYLNKKKIEQQYNDAELLEELRKKGHMPDTYNKKYDSLIHNLKMYVLTPHLRRSKRKGAPLILPALSAKQYTLPPSKLPELSNERIKGLRLADKPSHLAAAFRSMESSQNALGGRVV